MAQEISTNPKENPLAGQKPQCPSLARRVSFYLFGLLGGALLLSGLSSAQKIIAGYPLKPAGFLVPVLFGCLVGFILSLLYFRLMARNARLKNTAEQLQQASQALQESETRYRAIFEQSADALFLVRDWIFQCNTTACSLLQMEEEYLLGSRLEDLGHFPDLEEKGALFQAAQEGKPQRLPWKYERQDGALLHFDLHVQPITLLKQQVLLVIARDITALEKAQEDRQNLENQFLQSQKMEALGRLTGGVAHDFNNILSVITGYTDMVLDDYAPTPEQKELLEKVSRAGKSAAQLISQLLLFSRPQQMQPEDVDLNEVVSHIVKMLGRVLGDQVELHWNPAPSLPPIVADRSMIEQVLMNLAINARDAMPGGGNLTIQTEEVFLENILCDHCSWSKPGHYVLLSVKDTGIGMNDETLSHIFEPFFTTKETKKGTGLGLSTVYGIMKQHQGIVCVQSQPGEGSLFKTFWPLALEQNAPEEEKEPTPVEALPPGGTETILVAEDDPSVRELVFQILKMAGYQTLVAEDGQEALALFQEQQDKIDLVLTDVIMPRMNGMELFQNICKIAPAMPVLFVSGYSEEEFQADYDRGANFTLLPKPVKRKALLAAIRKKLDKTS